MKVDSGECVAEQWGKVGPDAPKKLSEKTVLHTHITSDHHGALVKQ